MIECWLFEYCRLLYWISNRCSVVTDTGFRTWRWY